MAMRALMEALQGQTSEAVAVVREGAEAEGMAVDAGFEGDGESLEPEGPNPGAEEDLFAGWEEGVPLVAISDTIAYTEDGEAVEVPAETTAEVVGVALDEDPPGAVIVLDDETMLAIDAEGAAGWGIVVGGEEDLEDEGAQDLEPEEPHVSATDEEPEMEGADPLLASLRAILDEGRKGKKGKRGKVAKGKADDEGGCAVGGQGRAVAEAVEPSGEAAEAAAAYVYALLLQDKLMTLMGGALGKPVVALTKALEAPLAMFLQRAKPVMREQGYAPAALQRLAGKLDARTAKLMDDALGVED